MRFITILKAAAAATAIALVLCGCLSSAERSLPLVITLQPEDTLTKPGETVTFETAAEGDGLSYQWYYKKPDSSRWSVWKGHDTKLTSAVANETWNGMRVYCCVTDGKGNSVATRAARISFGTFAEFTEQPTDVIVNLGETAYFRVSARGEGKLSYQWYYRKSHSVLWTKWKGHTAPETEAVANNSWNGMQLCCIVTDSKGNSAESQFATVTVIDSPTVISHPKSTRTRADGTAEFSVSGGTEGLLFQWFIVPRGCVFGLKMKNRNDAVLSLADVKQWNGAKVFCRLKSPGGSMIYSDKAALAAANEPVITSQPRIAAAATGGMMHFIVKASGEGLLYKWFFRYAGSAVWHRLAGYSGESVSVAEFRALSGGEIRCEVSDALGNRVYSQAAEVSVNDGIGLTRQPGDVTVSSGEEIRLTAKTDSQRANFQWYADKGFGWIMLAGQNGSELITEATPSMHGMKFKCRVSSPDGGHVYSREATVTVNDIFTIKSSPENVTAHSGDRAEFSVNAKGRGLQYQWLTKAKNSDEWQKWQGQNASSVTLPAELSWHRMSVRCDVTDCTGKLLSSDSARVWITDALEILKNPRGVRINAGDEAEFSVKAQGEGLRYQWCYRKSGQTSWHVWQGHNAARTSGISDPTWDGMRVFCIVTDSRGNKVYSNYATVRIIPEDDSVTAEQN